MRKFRLGNKGLSLLELLVGITMLAIIVVPVLHAMLTSSKTSSKAKEEQNQTFAAQNVLESYEATDIATVIDSLDKGSRPFGYAADVIRFEQLIVDQNGVSHYDAVADYDNAEKDGPGYKLFLNGIVSGGKSYDAVMTVSAAKYSDRNSVGIVDYKPMDAVYIQPKPGDNSNPDVIAAKDFASQAQIDSGTTVDYHYFLDKMARTITITIQKIGNQTGVVSCTARFNYAAHYEYTLTDDSTVPPTQSLIKRDYETVVNSDFYSGSYSENESGLYGLYFFFYPNMPTIINQGLTADTIDIVNSGNIGMSIYLIRQSAQNGTYNPAIKLMEKADGVNNPKAKMYYNKQSQTYSYHIGFSDGMGGLRYIWRKSYPFDGNLIGTPAQNRLYEVTVDLYKAGSVKSDGSVLGTPLATFNASSLE